MAGRAASAEVSEAAAVTIVGKSNQSTLSQFTLMQLRIALRFVFVGLSVFAALRAWSGEPLTWQIFQHERVLGTSLELKFQAPSAEAARRAETAALAEIDRLGSILSGYDVNSEFRRWAATRDVAVKVSPELFDVLSLFDAWRERTGGALDASAEVAGRLWRQAAESQRVPSGTELATAVAAVHQVHWRLDPSARTATHVSQAPLMLNSFAKIFVIERACQVAVQAGGLSAAVVNLGGDLVVRGQSTEVIAIADPEADSENDAAMTRIAVRNRAVATSGGYRRGVEIAGRWYSHLVDPRTGRPVEHVRSATVVAARATDAGALATALCVMTPAEGLQQVATVVGAECLLVLNDGRRVTSPGWAGLVAPSPMAVFGAVRAESAASTTTAGIAWDSAFELVVNLEIAPADNGRSRRPFLAAWIEDKDGFPVRTIALWFNKPRWLPDLRAWSHADNVRAMAEGTQIADSISSATRAPGKYTLKWDGKDSAGKPVARGTYTVAIEVAREHGTHQLIRHDLALYETPQKVSLPANVELSSVSLDYHRKEGAR